jgi:hypothetical protein
MKDIILCDKCIRSFGTKNALLAEYKATRNSILLSDKQHTLYLCEGHVIDVPITEEWTVEVI